MSRYGVTTHLYEDPREAGAARPGVIESRAMDAASMASLFALVGLWTSSGVATWPKAVS